MARKMLENLALATLSGSGCLGGRLPLEFQDEERLNVLAELLPPHVLDMATQQCAELLRQAYFAGVLAQHEETAGPEQVTEDHFRS